MCNNLQLMRAALAEPTAIIRGIGRVVKFYRFLKKENKYIMVAVKALNGDAFVITSYFTFKIQYE